MPWLEVEFDQVNNGFLNFPALFSGRQDIVVFLIGDDFSLLWVSWISVDWWAGIIAVALTELGMCLCNPAHVRMRFSVEFAGSGVSIALLLSNIQA